VNVPTGEAFQAPNPIKRAFLATSEYYAVHRVADNHPSPAEGAWSFFIAYDSVNTFIFIEFDLVV
jgi:hypothetical protein